MSKETTAIEMYVGGLFLDPQTQAPVVVLKDESGEICLPIWIGIAEATSIASVIKQVSMARPLTHDLMCDLFDQLGVKVQRVLITDLKDSTYFAELVLSIGDKVIIMDSRPSDALAIALRSHSQIFVNQAVLDQAKITFANQAQGTPPEGAEPAEGPAGEAGKEAEEQAEPSIENTFTQIDKDKWAEILGELDPDDFKYKM